MIVPAARLAATAADLAVVVEDRETSGGVSEKEFEFERKQRALGPQYSMVFPMPVSQPLD
jgi:hypothetical protein